MAVGLEIKYDTAKLISALTQFERQQIPYATMLALNKSAQDAQKENRDEMIKVFDRPTPFTLKSTRIEWAKKNKLEARVYLKDDGKGSSALTRMSPEVFGGQRGFKKMEGAMRAIGILAADEQLMPGGAAKLDQYGNMSRGEIVQILAWFKAFPESGGYRRNMSDKQRGKLVKGTKSKAGMRYFAKLQGPGRGIYRAVGKGGASIEPVLMFGKRAVYKVRLDMASVVRTAAEQKFPGHFKTALEQALRTAR